jgi:hypothetical protein
MGKLLYTIDKDKHNKNDIYKILTSNKNIKFVSLMGVDLGGNATDEKIPIKLLLEDIEKFLKTPIQTDGSSVELYNIATSKSEVETYNKKYNIGSGKYSDYEYVCTATMCFIQPEFGILKTAADFDSRSFGVECCLYAPYNAYSDDYFLNKYVDALYRYGGIGSAAKDNKCKEFPLSLGLFKTFYFVVKNKKSDILDLIFVKSQLKDIIVYHSVP